MKQPTFKTLLIAITWAFGAPLHAQVTNSGLMDTTTGERIKDITVGAYMDLYYGYNFQKPPNGNIPYFVSMNRHNELNINLAYLDIRYQTDRVRGRFVPGFGTYMNANYAGEQGTLRNLVEASVGFKPFAERKLWLDAGVLGSPYSNESAVSKDNFMYSRSLSSDYVPYYLSGIKLSAPAGKKFTLYAYILNGWQQIIDVNSHKSLGTQVEYRPNDKNLLNWNTYIGDERSSISPDNRMRYFSDLYWIYNPNEKWSITSCVYGGFQTSTQHPNLNKNTAWWQSNFISRYRFNEQHSLSGRIEYFSDPNAIQISPLNEVSGFSTFSGGLCYNNLISKALLFRLEGRYFSSKEKLFLNNDGNRLNESNSNLWIVSNLTLWF